MGWRVAKSLETLRSQVNGAHPDRSKDSDGTIGDAAHASRDSDHNPWVQDGGTGVVTAMDITHDPGHGVDTYVVAETLRQNRDSRIKYVISNRRIFAGANGPSPFIWRAYSGSNPHDHHIHVSVLPDKVFYDDTRPWNLASDARPVLRNGSTGEAVKTLQRLLGIEADGIFGDQTEAAVKQFQATHALAIDGVVGPYTWRALDSKPAGITATVFGGKNDPQESAYEKRQITDDELGCALPFRFSGARPRVKVTNKANGKSVVCQIVDVGPWNTNDPYWTKGARPQAETGTATSGRKTNGAGIDLTVAAAAAIGLPGKGLVDWEFVTDQKPTSTPKETKLPNTPLPISLPKIDLAALEQTVEHFSFLLTFITPFFPAAPVLLAVLETILKAGADLQKSDGSLAHISNTLGDHFIALGGQLKALAPAGAVIGNAGAGLPGANQNAVN